MTTFVSKEEEKKKFLENWLEGVIKNTAGYDLIVSNNSNGRFSAPSQRKKFYQTAGFSISPDVFKKEDIKPFLKSISFAFYFVPKDVIDFEGIDGKEEKET